MKQKIYKKIIALLILLFVVAWFFTLASPVLAGDVNDLWGGTNVKSYVQTNSGLPAEPNMSDPRFIIANIIRFILSFLGIIAVIIVLYAGFRWMFSGGNEDTISKAKGILWAGLVGLIIILLAYAIASFVINQLFIATS
jgi:hypothetical protein